MYIGNVTANKSNVAVFASTDYARGFYWSDEQKDMPTKTKEDAHHIPTDTRKPITFNVDIIPFPLNLRSVKCVYSDCIPFTVELP